MEFSITKSTFQKALHTVHGIAEQRAVNPILSHVLLQASEGKLSLTTNNLEVCVQSTVPAEIKTDGAAVLSARKLLDISGELPGESVNVELGEHMRVSLVSAKSKFYLPSLKAEEFPAFPEFQEEGFNTISAAQLKEMIRKTIFGVSTDQNRYGLSGIFFENYRPSEEEIYLRLVATDGHRLALAETKREQGEVQGLGQGVIIPRKCLAELIRIVEGEKEDLEFSFQTNSGIIRFTKDDMSVLMTVHLVDAQFPDYSTVIPKDNPYVVRLPREEFRSMVRRVSLMATGERAKPVALKLGEGLLTLTSEDREQGFASDEMAVEYRGEELQIGFNSVYLLDVINSLESDELIIELNDELRPAMLRGSEEPGYLFVIMPMRLEQ